LAPGLSTFLRTAGKSSEATAFCIFPRSSCDCFGLTRLRLSLSFSRMALHLFATLASSTVHAGSAKSRLLQGQPCAKPPDKKAAVDWRALQTTGNLSASHIPYSLSEWEKHPEVGDRFWDRALLKRAFAQTNFEQMRGKLTWQLHRLTFVLFHSTEQRKSSERSP
jgi:hypothetical protein